MHLCIEGTFLTKSQSNNFKVITISKQPLFVYRYVILKPSSVDVASKNTKLSVFSYLVIVEILYSHVRHNPQLGVHYTIFLLQGC